MSILVRDLFNCYDFFLRLLGFPFLFAKVFLIDLKFSELDFSTFSRVQRKQNKFLWTFKRILFLTINSNYI